MHNNISTLINKSSAYVFCLSPLDVSYRNRRDPFEGSDVRPVLSRVLLHSSKLRCCRTFILMRGLHFLIVFAASFQSSARPNVTNRAHITATLRPWPKAQWTKIGRFWDRFPAAHLTATSISWGRGARESHVGMHIYGRFATQELLGNSQVQSITAGSPGGISEAEEGHPPTYNCGATSLCTGSFDFILLMPTYTRSGIR